MNKKATKQNAEEINLREIIFLLKRKRKPLIMITMAFVFIGIMFGFLSETEYTSSTTFIPQTRDQGTLGGNMSGLASLAGINLGNASAGGSSIPPSLYPKISESLPFKLKLLNSQVYISELNDSITIRKYFNEYYTPSGLFYLKKYTLGLPSILKNNFMGPVSLSEVEKPIEEQNILQINSNDRFPLKKIQEVTEISPNLKEGIVTLSVTMSDPILAAQIAKLVERELQDELIAFKVADAKVQYEFIQKQYDEKKEEFEKSQSRLANFKDRNQGLVTAFAQTELQRLESEFNLVFSVYSDLAKQLEQAKIQVSKNTPIFSVIDPVSVPQSKSGPNMLFIFIGSVVLGAFLAVSYILISNYLFEED
ncbi:Wzz/FepE/Etk N-terminal domain-containing protein [Algoriphagus hitonicola]|uniref:Chain length determinant protein n=1 Tax=Algoriphagus hitonicola TaxID=435880 RepID=A0A1I2X4M4_9BACT|nr:Wzz/FepE/Etk N-terminal domain-containing protein [Algoriphagus hitonicola]SFH08470.1 Chain length determinant protein [Algoriphagus hitonicola]